MTRINDEKYVEKEHGHSASIFFKALSYKRGA